MSCKGDVVSSHRVGVEQEGIGDAVVIEKNKVTQRLMFATCSMFSND